MKKYTHVSLFSGAGGLDIGLENAGFRTIWANDINHDACETHKLWSDAEVVEGSIGDINVSDIPDSDIISGGFPCQGFSLAGPRKIDDSRNALYHYYVNIVERKKPKLFIAENVKGILTLGNGQIIEAIEQDFRDKGYIVKKMLLNAQDFNVPQERARVIIVGVREDIDIPFEYPTPELKRLTLREGLSGIEYSPEDVCDAAYSSRYMSRNRKRTWDELSYTIPAMAKQVALHPSSPDMIKIDTDHWIFGEGETRRLSYKEAAAIQTFPKEMIFTGDLTSKYKQIGNAVPVMLAKAVGLKAYELLEKAG